MRKGLEETSKEKRKILGHHNAEGVRLLKRLLDLANNNNHQLQAAVINNTAV